MFAVVAVVRDTGVLLLVAHPVGDPPLVTWAQMYSPTLPAFALLFVVVPTMPAVCDGVIVLVKVAAPLNVGVPLKVPDKVAPAMVGVVSDGDVPNTAAPVPVSSDSTPSNCAEVVEANCDRLLLVSANVVPQEKPVPLVYFSALFAVLQLGSATAVGAAVDPVVLAIAVFAPTGASEPATTLPHAGAVLAPVETMAWPDVDPAGLSSWTGVVVAAEATAQNSAAASARTLRISGSDVEGGFERGETCFHAAGNEEGELVGAERVEVPRRTSGSDFLIPGGYSWLQHIA